VPAKYNVKITKNAECDLEKIYAYISKDSPDNAVNFICKIEEKIHTLEEFPGRCPVIPESEFLGIEYRHIIIGNYRIIFKNEKNAIYIMRIIHSAQLLKY
jgi:plasmid stabilization system protein ParE